MDTPALSAEASATPQTWISASILPETRASNASFSLSCMEYRSCGMLSSSQDTTA